MVAERAGIQNYSLTFYDAILSDSEETRIRRNIKRLSDQKDKRIQIILSREEVGVKDQLEFKHYRGGVEINKGVLIVDPSPHPSPSSKSPERERQ